MELLGYEITVRRKAAIAPIRHTDGGWRSFIAEPFAGAWQRNIERVPKNVLTHSTVYACVDRIAQDCGKMWLRIVSEDADGVFTVVESPAFSPVLRKPNRYQTTQKFIEQWIHSKLINGNAYIWKERDNRNVVVALYVLEPTKVRAFVAPDGSVFYQIGNDNLSGIQETSLQVPASEIIHDVNAAFYHPLCGVSPITACALPACHGLNIQEFSEAFFANNAKPGGMLTAPGFINAETAERLKAQFEQRFSGSNVGKLYVAGDGLEYKPMTITAHDSQLIEQLKWTAEQVCTCFHVPAYKVGVGPPPAYNNIEALNTQYFSEALQALIRAIQTLLDEGLALPKPLSAKFNLEDLLLMDMSSRIMIAKEGVGAGIFSPDEARRKFNYGKVEGGNTPYLQQQNYSLAALAKRDAQEDPFGTAPAPAPEPTPEPEPETEPDDEKTIDLTNVRGRFVWKAAA